MEILRIENLSFRYPNASNNALTNVNFSVKNGEFVVICGESGCGKTTLLKLLKNALAPVGEKSGSMFYKGTLLDALDERTSAFEMGYVFQNPDNQIVTDKVWHELAFGLENMGLQTDVIRRKVGEMASYFGIQSWFHKNTDELSGGEKQILNLASVMAMNPEILLLDEPTGQLDPIAASEFISTLQKLNRDLGLTVILVEHRMEEVFPIADKVLVLDKGKVLFYDEPKTVGRKLSDVEKEHPMHLGLPSAVRIYNALNLGGECPLTVKEGKDYLDSHFSPEETVQNETRYEHGEDVAIELKDVCFKYKKDLPDVLKNTSLKVYKGEHFCILGGNGSGKTTLLNVVSGLDKPYRGKVLINGKSVKSYKGSSLYRSNLAMLPQNPQTVFIKDNVYDDFLSLLETLEIPKEEYDARINTVSEKVGISELLNKHPYDLSGGEQQKCALAKMLLLEPKILLLDEPTKGLDALSKTRLKAILNELKNNGITIVTVTHDVEFAAVNADRCGLFFDGDLLSSDTPEKFFPENNFYTTAANRMSRHIWKNAVTCEQVVQNAKMYGGYGK